MTDAELGRQIAAYLDATTKRATLPTDTRTEIAMTTNDGPSRRVTTRWLATAAAVVVLVGAGAVALSARSGSDDGEPDPADAPVATLAAESEETIPPPSDDADLTPEEREAIDLAERYFAALYAGDVETVIELTPKTSLRVEAESAWVRHWATTADDRTTTDDVWPVGPCRAGTESAEGLLVTCPVRSHDAVAVAMGVGDLTWNVYITTDGAVDAFISPTAGFRSYLDRSRTYAAYLEMIGEFRDGPCDADTYDTGAVYDPGIAMSQACADLVIGVADDAAAWFEAGQPDEWPPADG